MKTDWILNSLQSLMVFILVQVTWKIDAAKFTSNPPSTIVASKGESIWFPWQFDLEGSELVTYECGFFNTTTKSFVPLVEGTNTFTVLTKWRQNVIAYPSNKTFAIKKLTYSDANTYYCILLHKQGSTFEKLKSNMTKVTVEAMKTKKDPRSGLSPGAITGVIIGSIVLLVIILGVVAWKWSKLARCFRGK